MSGTAIESKADTQVIGTRQEFTSEDFKTVAVAYRANRRMIDAIATAIGRKDSGLHSLDDALARVRDTWDLLESMRENGSGFTPATELNFGRVNGTEIATMILGYKRSIGEIRTALANVGVPEKSA